MPCYNPLRAWRSQSVNESGKRSLVFKPAGAFLDMPVTVPCGVCIGCRLDKSREWAMRCMHERDTCEESCFLTLTYNDKNVPWNMSLYLPDFQKFMKRLRKRFGFAVNSKGVSNGKPRIRYFACGEYGDRFERPHYHACIFGYRPSDCRFWKTSESGYRVYRSDILDHVWSCGDVYIGDVGFQSAAYVARYVFKKVTGDAAPAHYGDRCPEFVVMSRNPGLGAKWIEQYKDEVFTRDEVIVDGSVVKPPRFYEQFISDKDLQRIKKKRMLLSQSEESSSRRLRVREKVKKAQVKQLKRGD